MSSISSRKVSQEQLTRPRESAEVLRLPVVPRESAVFASKLKARIVKVSRLSLPLRTRLWQVFKEYYADVNRETFERDLSNKSHVILLLDRRLGAICGFSTFVLYQETIEGQRIGVLYSGDTIIQRDYWGQTALQRAFILAFLRYKLRYPWLSTYWFLISKGYKTYLLLSRNYCEYWPRHDRKTPGYDQAILHALSARRFPESYLPELGILRFDKPQGMLREHVAPIELGQLQVPDIRFFHTANPGHARGEELCCIGKFDTKTILRASARMLRKGLLRLWKACS